MIDAATGFAPGGVRAMLDGIERGSDPVDDPAGTGVAAEADRRSTQKFVMVRPERNLIHEMLNSEHSRLSSRIEELKPAITDLQLRIEADSARLKAMREELVDCEDADAIATAGIRRAQEQRTP